jgi:hypothetical protein
MINRTNQSQIATIIVFIIAVMFIFTLLSLNLGRIAQKKTALDNVADSVGLSLASQLGSMANALKNQLEIYGASVENCDLNWRLMLGVFLIVAAIVGAVFSGGVSLLLINVALAGALLTATGATMQFMAANPAVVSQLQLKFKNLSALQQVIEMPIQGVLFNVNEDPGWVTDVYDMDRDNDHTDRIPRFLKWYNLRLNALPDVGGLVDGFLTQGFPGNGIPYSFFNLEVPSSSAPSLPLERQRFYRDLDENWMVRPGEDSVRWWIDYNNDGLREFKIVPWLRDELPGLLSTMREYGYGINVGVDASGMLLGIIDEPEGLSSPGVTVVRYESGIGTLIGEIEDFENIIVRGLSDIDRDTAVQGLDAWASLLKNDTNEDWYTRLGNLQSRLQALRAKLQERKNRINNCVYSCWWYPWTCSSRALCRRVGSVCRWRTVCDATDPDTGECTSSHQEPSAWEACCGTIKRCGLLCDDNRCPPPRSDYDGNPINGCQTPLGGERYCCEVTDLEPYNSTSYGCFDNIVDVYPNTAGTDGVLIRHNAITILNKFISDITQVRSLINTFSSRINVAVEQTYDMAHEAFYLWQDNLGGVSSQREMINHIVYARIEGIDPGAGFELPHAAQTSDWLWVTFPPLPRICMRVEDATGRFKLTVARFDESPTGTTGLLTRFWRFLFSKGVLNSAEKTLVAQEAANYTNQLASNTYYQITDQATKTRLKNILQRSGMVTKIQVNYGPGYTPRPPATAPAARRNRDIYIVRTSSDMNM